MMKMDDLWSLVLQETRKASVDRGIAEELLESIDIGEGVCDPGERGSIKKGRREAVIRLPAVRRTCENMNLVAEISLSSAKIPEVKLSATDLVREIVSNHMDDFHDDAKPDGAERASLVKGCRSGSEFEDIAAWLASTGHFPQMPGRRGWAQKHSR